MENNSRNKQYKLVEIPLESKEQLHALKHRFKLRQTRLLAAMIDYFHRHGYNPIEPVESTSAELAKLRNAVIGFFKTQEKEYIKPTISKVNDMVGQLSEISIGLEPMLFSTDDKKVSGSAPIDTKLVDLQLANEHLTTQVRDYETRLLLLNQLIEKKTIAFKDYNVLNGSFEDVKKLLSVR
ncbi:MAG: BfmA/BtgA family mobilization protein [Bacteroidota bacterium]